MNVNYGSSSDSESNSNKKSNNFFLNKKIESVSCADDTESVVNAAFKWGAEETQKSTGLIQIQRQIALDAFNDFGRINFNKGDNSFSVKFLQEQEISSCEIEISFDLIKLKQLPENNNFIAFKRVLFSEGCNGMNNQPLKKTSSYSRKDLFFAIPYELNFSFLNWSWDMVLKMPQGTYFRDIFNEFVGTKINCENSNNIKISFSEVSVEDLKEQKPLKQSSNLGDTLFTIFDKTKEPFMPNDAAIALPADLLPVAVE
jgi:hypothetical protein